MRHCGLPFCVMLVLCPLISSAARAEAGSGGEVSILERLVKEDQITTRSTPEGLRIVGLGRVSTTEEFKSPVVITAVVTLEDSASIVGISYGQKGWFGLNYSLIPVGKSMGYQDPVNGHPITFYTNGELPIGKPVTIRWTLGKSQSRIEVDGETRCLIPGDYSGLSGAIGVNPNKHHPVQIHSLKVQTGDVPESPEGLPPEPLQILEAHWGSDQHQVDVTGVLQKLVKDGVLEVRPSDELFGVPKGEGEEMGVTYRLKGAWGAAAFPQDAPAKLGGAGAVVAFPVGAVGSAPRITPPGQAAAGGQEGPEPAIDPKAIEQRAYRNRAKAIVKSMSTIHGMEVVVREDGSEVGSANDIIAVVPGDTRERNESSVKFVREGEGDQMKTSLEEAIRAVRLRASEVAARAD